MLHRSRITYTIHGLAKFGLPVFSLVAAAEAGLNKMPERPEWGPTYGLLKTQAGVHGWWVIIVATFMAWLCTWISKKYGNPEVWEILHSLLNGIRDYVFSKPENPDQHKVTLFQSRCHRDRRDVKGICRRIAGQKPKWLVPIVRSGHTSQETKACFPIGDNDVDCQGVAGQAWFQNRMLSVSDLPDLETNASADQIEAYASRTFVSKEVVRRNLPRARSLLAVPVPLKGEPWGVLVFDSRKQARIDGESVDTLLKILSSHLSDLIGKVL